MRCLEIRCKCAILSSYRSAKYFEQRGTDFLLSCWRADTLASSDQDLRDLDHEGFRESIAQNVNGSMAFFGTVSSSGTLATAQRV